MKSETNVLFSDGRKVLITSQELIVDSARYLLKGIADVRLHFVRHYKYPPLTLLIAGIIALLSGLTGVFSNVKVEELYLGDFLVTANGLAIVIGGALVLMSLIWLSVLHDEYVMVITTEEGNRNPLSSRRKAYIHRIVSALKDAIHLQQTVNKPSQNQLLHNGTKF